jgi:hypothetical protein
MKISASFRNCRAEIMDAFSVSCKPRSFARPPPSCPALDAEELGFPGPPLVREGLPVNQDQRGCLVRGDDGDRCFEVVRGQFDGGFALECCQG